MSFLLFNWVIAGMDCNFLSQKIYQKHWGVFRIFISL